MFLSVKALQKELENKNIYYCPEAIRNIIKKNNGKKIGGRWFYEKKKMYNIFDYVFSKHSKKWLYREKINE